MKLIVSEKPIAAERIAEILGKPKAVTKGGVTAFLLDDSVVVPLKGHITNVDFPAEYKSWAQTKLDSLVDAKLLYEVMQLGIKRMLEEYGRQASEMIIATDYDSEGESIGREAIEIVKAVNPKIKVKRSKFSSLTSEEVKAAFAKPVDFDYNLADSADTRREADLIWGAVLTRYVSLTARRLGKDFLSVGRVQSPTLALVVDREKEILKFKPKDFWAVSLLCDKKGEKFVAAYEKEKLFDKAEADRLTALRFKTAEVKSAEKKELEIKPPTPFNTTEFLRSASMLGFQPEHAMSVAERLYMSGLTSYPRVDNTVYPDSLNLKEILKKLSKSKDFGKLAEKILAQKAITPTRGKRLATDHPPIHPVEVADKAKLSGQEWRVYSLIVHRFLATLAPSSMTESVKVVLDYGGENFIARGKTVLSEGWREFYPYSKMEDVFLPALAVGDVADVEKVECKQDKTKPKPRYTPAALIKLLEDLNLGTKSTRATIIQKLMDRGYISGRQNFTPSQIAFAVIDALEEYAPDIAKPDMTANLEAEMEDVELGKKVKAEVVADSRKLLHKIVDELMSNQLAIGDKLRTALRAGVTVGKCPSCGKDLIIINTARGTRFVGCTGYKDGCRTAFPLPAKGRVTPLGTKCASCAMPEVEVQFFRRRPFRMCLLPSCPTKANWGKKKEAKKEEEKKAGEEKAEKKEAKPKKPRVVRKRAKAVSPVSSAEEVQ